MNNSTGLFYNWFSFIYPVVALCFKPQKHRLFKEVNSAVSGDLLEIGIGNGSNLSSYKNHTVTGIDISTRMLKIAAKKKATSTRLLQMNGEQLQFGDCSFDYIVLSHVIAVSPCPEKILEECLRVLKPGGIVYILNHFTPNNGLKYVDRAFRPFSKYFHFTSEFYSENLVTLQKFTLLNEIKFRPLSYFKLLIFTKT